jgi:hypothetical protein
MSTKEGHDGKADRLAEDGGPELLDEQLDETSGGSSKDPSYMTIKLDPERIRVTTGEDDATRKLRKDD